MASEVAVSVVICDYQDEGWSPFFIHCNLRICNKFHPFPGMRDRALDCERTKNMPHIEIPVRYGREITDPSREPHERNLRSGKLRWSLPVQETALVLVDCWDYFPLESFVTRAAEICRTKIRPVLEACRELGVTVIHAPSPQWAANYPDFHYRALREPQEEGKALSELSASDVWPPKSLTKEGAFAVPRAEAEPTYKVWWETAFPDNLRISTHLEPARNDIVVSTGDELHTVCCQGRIKHLVYAGFATNICVLNRDYGVRSMKGLGYNIVFIRDATTGVESSETVDGLWATRSAIFYIEIKVGVTVTAEAFLDACRSLR